MFYDEKDNTIYFKNGCGYTDVVNSLSNFSHILSGTSLEPEVDLKLDGDTKNVTFPTYDCKIASKSIVNGKEVICMDIISDDCTNSRANEIIDAFDDLPTVDVAEIVRCKDCRYFRTSPEYCPKICSDEVHENFYCAYGSKCKTN